MGRSKATHCKWEGSYKTKDGLYEVDFRADGHAWHSKQTYFEPEESEIECDECKILKVTSLKDDSEVTLAEDVKEKICNEIMDLCEDGQYEEDFFD